MLSYAASTLQLGLGLHQKNKVMSIDLQLSLCLSAGLGLLLTIFSEFASGSVLIWTNNATTAPPVVHIDYKLRPPPQAQNQYDYGGGGQNYQGPNSGANYGNADAGSDYGDGYDNPQAAAPSAAAPDYSAPATASAPGDYGSSGSEGGPTAFNRSILLTLTAFIILIMGLFRL